MKAKFFRMLEELRGVQYVLQDDRIIYTRSDSFMPYGFMPEDAIGHSVTEWVAPECRDEVLQIHRTLKARQQPTFYNTVLLIKDGSRVPVRCAVWPTTYQGKPAIAGMIARIYGEHEAVPQTGFDDQYQLLLKSAARAGEGIAVFQTDGDKELICTYANEEVSHISGYAAVELKDLKFSELFNTGIGNWAVGTGNIDRAGGRYELEVFKKGGGTIPVEICLAVAETDPGRPATIIFMRDISERKEWESRNLKLQRSLRCYARQIVKAQERERKRLARELHDNTIQVLILICNQLQVDGGSSPGRLAKLSELADNALNDLRNFTWDLRPPLLDDMGLAPTLRWFADKISKISGLKSEVTVVGEERRLPPEVELSLFRIAQEALNNACRHAHASSAKVTIEFTAQGVRLSIQDDGCGMGVPARTASLVSKGKLGLASINERCLELGAILKIESQLGYGTTIRVDLPAQDIAQPAAAP